MARKIKLGPFNEKEFIKDLQALKLPDQGLPTDRYRRSVYALPAEPKEIKAARKAVHYSQTKFAAALGVAPATIQAWEQGKRQPDGPASKILRLNKKMPGLIEELART